MDGRALKPIGLALIAMMLLLGCQGSIAAGGEAARQTALSADVRPALPRYPSVPPAGIPPVVGNGALAILPLADSGTMLPVTAELSGGWLATVLVAADPSRSIAVRMQALPAETFDPPPPDGSAMMLTIDLFDAETGQALAVAPSASAVGVRPPPGLDASTLVLWQFDASSVGYRPLRGSLDDSREALSAWLPQRPALTIAIILPSQTAPTAAESPRGSIAADARANAAPTPITDIAAPRVPLPARIAIPAIGVDAPIAPVGLEDSGIMASPTEGHVVGWYELGARPGEPSNAVLAGHVDLHKQPGAFFRLRELEPGATIDVDTGLGIAFRYVVDEIRTYRATDAPLAEIFGPTTSATLTLITCGGQFDSAQQMYLDRVVVRAHGR